MKTTSSSGIWKTIYNSSSYLLVFGKRMTKFWNFVGIISLTLK